MPRLAAAIVAASGTLAIARGADGPSRLDDVLARWEAKASTWKTLDVRFTREDRSRVWGMTNFEGTLLLKDERTAALDFKTRDEPPAFQERTVWTDSEWRQFDARTRQIFLLPRPQGDPVRLPDTLCLPFLYGRKAEELRRRFDIRLEKDGETSYLLRLDPRKDAPPVDAPKGTLLDRVRKSLLWPAEYPFRTAYLELDKETFLPRMYLLIDLNGADRQTYRVTSYRPNEPIADSFFRVRGVEGWKVITSPATGG